MALPAGTKADQGIEELFLKILETVICAINHVGH
jgi:hypothetical protein